MMQEISQPRHEVQAEARRLQQTNILQLQLTQTRLNKAPF